MNDTMFIWSCYIIVLISSVIMYAWLSLLLHMVIVMYNKMINSIFENYILLNILGYNITFHIITHFKEEKN